MVTAITVGYAAVDTLFFMLPQYEAVIAAVIAAVISAAATVAAGRCVFGAANFWRVRTSRSTIFFSGSSISGNWKLNYFCNQVPLCHKTFFLFNFQMG